MKIFLLGLSLVLLLGAGGRLDAQIAGPYSCTDPRAHRRVSSQFPGLKWLRFAEAGALMAAEETEEQAKVHEVLSRCTELDWWDDADEKMKEEVEMACVGLMYENENVRVDLSSCIELKGGFTPDYKSDERREYGKLKVEFANTCPRIVFVPHCYLEGASISCDTVVIPPEEQVNISLHTENRLIWQACQYKKDGYLESIGGGADSFFKVDGPCWMNPRGEWDFSSESSDTVHSFPVLPANEELLDAVRWGEIETVERLLAAGADINHQDGNGETALHEAVEHIYSVDNIKPLLEAGADVHLRDESGNTVLLKAAYGGNIMAIDDGYGGDGYLDAVERLLAAGADVNHQNKDGQTALQIAVGQGYGDSRLVERLLAAGADVNHQNKDGQTALHLAAGMKHRVEYLDMCGSGGCGIDPDPAKDGYPETVSRLLAAGADVNRQDKDGRTALHLAARKGHINAVKRLLATAGADIHHQDKDGQTALHLAAVLSHPATAELLREADNP